MLLIHVEHYQIDSNNNAPRQRGALLLDLK